MCGNTTAQSIAPNMLIEMKYQDRPVKRIPASAKNKSKKPTIKAASIGICFHCALKALAPEFNLTQAKKPKSTKKPSKISLK